MKKRIQNLSHVQVIALGFFLIDIKNDDLVFDDFR